MAASVIVLGDLPNGIDLTKGVGNAVPTALKTLTNAYITPGRKARKRPGFKKFADLDARTVGLAGAHGKLHCFYSDGTSPIPPTTNPQIEYHATRYPAVQQNLEAAFTYSLDNLTASFVDQSESDTEITSWTWDFGDGSGSTAQNPEHTYEEGGEYTVKLTIIDSREVVSEVSVTISVTDWLDLIETANGADFTNETELETMLGTIPSCGAEVAHFIVQVENYSTNRGAYYSIVGSNITRLCGEIGLACGAFVFHCMVIGEDEELFQVSFYSTATLANESELLLTVIDPATGETESTHTLVVDDTVGDEPPTPDLYFAKKTGEDAATVLPAAGETRILKLTTVV